MRLLILAITLCIQAAAQTSSGIARHVQWGTVLPATCSHTTGDVFALVAGASATYYNCTAANTWTVAGGGTVTAIQGNSVESGTPNTQAQFYAWDTATSLFKIYSLGANLCSTGTTVNVCTDTIQTYSSGTSVPGSCTIAGGQVFYKTDAAVGAQWYGCNGSTFDLLAAAGSATAGNRITVSGSTINHTYIDGKSPGFWEEFWSWRSTTGPGSLGFIKGTVAGTLTLAELGVSAYSATPYKNPGVVKMTTSAVSGDGGSLYLTTGGSNSFLLQSVKLGTSQFKYSAVVCLTSTANIAIWAGLGASPATFAAGGNDSIYLRYDSAADSTWKLSTTASSTPGTPVNTTTSPATGCHQLNLMYSGTTMSGWVDAGTPVTIALTSTANVAPYVALLTRTTAAAIMEVDAIGLELTSITTRY